MLVVFVAAFLGYDVRLTWVQGRIGRNGVLSLVAMVVAFGLVDYGLLRFYERRGIAIRKEDNPL